MSCRLHLPVIYMPALDAVRCECGEVVITRVEAHATKRGRAWFHAHSGERARRDEPKRPSRLAAWPGWLRAVLGR